MINKIRTAMMAVCTATLLPACVNPPTGGTTPIGDFEVSRLFTNEGCSVYRFMDGRRPIYYVNCGDSSATGWTEGCGKNCARGQFVTGARHREEKP